MPDIPSIPVNTAATGKASRGAAVAERATTGEQDDSRARGPADETSFNDSLRRQLAAHGEQSDESQSPPDGNSLPPGGEAAESGRTMEPMPAISQQVEATAVTRMGKAEQAGESAPRMPDRLQQARVSAAADAVVRSGVGADSAALAAGTVLNADAGQGSTNSLFMSRMMQSGADLSGEMPAGRNTLDSVQAGSRAASVDAAGASVFRSPSPLNASADVSAPAQAAVTESFGRPEWSQGLGRQMLWMVNQNLRSAEMRMNPANLGPIEVRIDMDDDQVSVAFNSRHAVVRDAVEMAIPRLREMFEAEGLNLAHTDVSHQSFAEQRDSAFAEDSGRQAGLGDAASAHDDSVAQQQNGGTAVSNGLVDCYI